MKSMELLEAFLKKQDKPRDIKEELIISIEKDEMVQRHWTAVLAALSGSLRSRKFFSQ